jgi:hypothetical protein
MITLARTRTPGEVSSHGDPERRRGEELVGDGGAVEFHKITTKLLEVTAWLEKERGELTTARRSVTEGERGGGPLETKSRKANNGCASRYK